MVDVLGGDWAREFTPYRIGLPVGELSLGSRQGITSHLYAPVVCGGSSRAIPTDRRTASRWRGAARGDCWSIRRLSVIGFGWPAASTTSPPSSGLTRARRSPPRPPLASSHRTARPVYGVAGTTTSAAGWPVTSTAAQRPIVYNSWYATAFDVRPDHQLALADRAAELGVEASSSTTAGSPAATNDRRGLGNWWPDPAGVPGRARPADLRRAGPRPALRHLGRAGGGESRRRRASRPLLTGSIARATGRWSPCATSTSSTSGDPRCWRGRKPGCAGCCADQRITYLKWDMNRPISDGWSARRAIHGRQWAVQHAQGYHRVMRMLRTEFPHVTVEACSGGGGRIDLGGARRSATSCGRATRRDRGTGSPSSTASSPPMDRT